MEKLHKLLIAIFTAALVWSAVDNADPMTWLLEAFPALLAVVLLILTYKKFRFTNLTYIFIVLHCLILFIGAKYTYAEVPAFNWLKDALDMSRNNYDKVGHFAQGFIPALIARELLIRWNIVTKKRWMNFIVVSICLAISAFYELIEWFAAETLGDSAESFLGTQGYVWDTQSDMLCALIGALCMVIFLSKIQDKAIKNIPDKWMDHRLAGMGKGALAHVD